MAGAGIRLFASRVNRHRSDKGDVTLLAHPTDVRASQRAAGNLRANLDALYSTQPELARAVDALSDETAARTEREFVFARDGYLTAREQGRWATGCSLPLRTAQVMLESLQNRAPVGCFLEPAHAAQLAVVLERFDHPQAVIAIVENLQTLRFLLQCHNFASDLADHRLWFAAGMDWAGALARLLQEREGLPVPSAFIRLPTLAEETAEARMRQAREVFAAETARRAGRVAAIQRSWPLDHAARAAGGNGKRVCVVAPTHFRLWDDGGWLLREALCSASANFVAFDPDRPTSASPLAFVQAATACDAVLTAGVFRADVPDVAPVDLPWLTLATSPRLAAPVAQARHDCLLLVDPGQRQQALDLGWPAERIHLAHWPCPARVATSRSAGANGESSDARAPLVLIADTASIDAPPEPLDLSSHQLLWELIGSELSADPFILGSDIGQYLEDRRRRLHIGEEGLDRALFIDRLIVPAFQQSIARLLIRRGVPLAIHGRGWEGVAGTEGTCWGPVVSRDDFLEVIAGAGALLHAWPIHGPHPIDAWQRPVARALQPDESRLLAVVTQALAPASNPGVPSLTTAPALSAENVLALLDG